MQKKEEKTIPQDSNKGCPGVEDKNAGKQDGCNGCPNQKACASGEAKQQLAKTKEEIGNKLESIKHKIVVMSGKGGVGKSTVATQVALSLAQKGYEVGLLDVDLCGPSVARLLGLDNQEVHSSNQGWSPVYVQDNLAVMSIAFLLNSNDEAVIWRGPRKTGLIKQFIVDVDWGHLDFLVVDTPPGTSDEHISIAQLLQLDQQTDGAVLVTTPQEIALMDVRKQLSFCRKSNIEVIGVIENMSGFQCPNCSTCSHIFPPSTGGAQQMCIDYSLNLLGQVPLNLQLASTADNGQPLQFKVFDPIIQSIEKAFIIE